MILARVIGTTVATEKADCYRGKKVLLVRPCNRRAEMTGTAFLAVDSVQAGVGDVVLVAREGNAARQVLGTADDPFHSVILAVVDEIHLASA